MKPFSALALLSMFLLCAVAVEKSADSHIEPICGRTQSHLKCPIKYEPVCGTDGVTYKNECFLCSKIWRTKLKIKIQKFEEC
uniref:probable pancreatic secretory proteinase inhibitor n=1 Tax=Pristiophorus japonicus TaxID=55135 RepID=UPI00398F89C7